MKALFILISIILSAPILLAQLSGQAKIDSLLKELPKIKEDTNAVNLLSTLSGELRSINPDKGIEYGLQGVELAKEIDWKKGEAKCYNSLATNYAGGKSNYPKALEYYNNALKINKEIGNKSGIAANLSGIGVIYKSQSDYPKALEYYHKSLKINEELGDEKSAAGTIHNIGVIYYFQSDYPKALEYYNKARKINEQEGGNKSWLANNLGNIGLIYMSQSDYPKALEYFHKALKIDEKLENKNGVARHLGNIGNIYSSQSDHPKALEYFHKALKIDEELGNKSGIARHLGNIGIEYSHQSNHPKALEYYHKALKIDEELGNKNGVARHLGNIGIIYEYQSNYPKALEYYHKALKINEELGNKSGIADNLGNMGALYLTLSQDSVLSNISEGTELVSLKKEINLNRSIEYSLQAIQLFEEIGDLAYRSTYLKILAEAYKQKGDYKKWGTYLEESHKLNDSVFNQENNEKLSNLEKLRVDDLNRMQIEKQEILLKAKEDEKQLILMSAGGALLAVLIILTLIINQRRKSEKLLLNILPASIAKRLKAKEENIADDFETATTIFIDLVGFTSFAKDKKASEVVKLLNKIFHRFDDLVNKHCLEKIKTMGDGYLAVSGVPDTDTNHCQKAINFALDIYNELEKFKKEMGLDINARIGIETGPLVAGVIGSSKFIYDIWGDSVNTASRMESTGTPGKIQITENVKTELEKQDNNFNFEKREPFEVKGKGIMQTYYLE